MRILENVRMLAWTRPDSKAVIPGKRTRIDFKWVSLVLSLLSLLFSTHPATANDCVTHGRIAKEAQPYVMVNDFHPALFYFENGAIYADIMHYDIFQSGNKKMHDDTSFTNRMMDLALTLEQCEWAAGFSCHQTADIVWTEWCDKYSVSRGVGMEDVWKFAFGAYSILQYGYCPPLLYPDPLLHPELYDLVWEAYVSLYDSHPDGEIVFRGKLAADAYGLWTFTWGEVTLTWILSPVLGIWLSLSKRLQESYENTIWEAASRSSITIGSRWYDYDTVGIYRIHYDPLNAEWHEYYYYSYNLPNPPVLTEGSERYGEPVLYGEDIDYDGWGNPFQTYTTWWTDPDDIFNPNFVVYITTRWNWVAVCTVMVMSQKKKEPVELPRLRLPSSDSAILMDAIATEEEEVPWECPEEPLLLKLDSKIEGKIDDREEELMDSIGREIIDMREAIQRDSLIYLDPDTHFTWKDGFVNLMAEKGVKTKCYFNTIDTLERKKEWLIHSANLIEIGQVEQCVNPGDYVTIPIWMDNNLTPLGGFELEVEFDYTSMTFVSAERGEMIADPDSFEYFAYRLLPCSSCPCCKYKILLFGMYDIPNGAGSIGQPIPITPPGEYGVLVNLNFVVNNDENLRGLMIPVCWEWEGTVEGDSVLVEDWDCNENTFSSWSGDTLFTSMLRCQFKAGLCDIPSDRIQPVLIFQNGICGQNCGGVLVCPVGSETCKHGDVNYNTLPYEVADAVLFASYFAQGIEVFSPPDSIRSYQICATDVNADGRTLTLSDLVYLIRVILHDAVEIPKLAPASVANVIVSNGIITTEGANIGAILFEFDGAVVPTLLADKMEMIAKDNKVLVWSREGHSLESTAQVVSFEGDANLTSVTAVDRDSRELKTSINAKVAPLAFALHPAYPNPFNPSTNLSFTLPEALSYNLKIYNVVGQLVISYKGMGKVGLNVITWDSKDNAGDEVASGIYFYQLTAGSFSATQKMVVVK